jgi:hypothetical protein
MNHANNPALLRTIIIYAICVPFAVWIGFLLAPESINPTAGNANFGGSVLNFFATHWVVWTILTLLLSAPILLRSHNLLLVACWHLPIMFFFLPGSPMFGLLMICLSLGISILHRTINNEARFISALPITLPLIFLAGVIVFTAKLTGGIGLHSLGSDVSGGKKYIFLFIGILGYFALTAQRIPVERAKLYVSLFFLGGCLTFIEDLAPYVPHAFYFLFAFFPVSGYNWESIGSASFHARFAGFGTAGMWGFFLMLARYGIRGIFLSRKLWRLLLFAALSACILLGGFRSMVILCMLAFAIQFFMERMHTTKAFPAFILVGVIAITLIIPFANKLPLTFQRSLAFLPLKIDPWARADAEGSEQWRLQIWKDMLQQVPHYLLLGKGYALSQGDLATASNQSFHYASDVESVDIVGNYHSGPLSVVIPFGLWGVIGVLWLWGASLFALFRNYRYGDEQLRLFNIFLLAYFIAQISLFIIIFGALEGDLAVWAGIVGLSIALNGGICKSIPKTAPTAIGDSIVPARMRFQPAVHGQFVR